MIIDRETFSETIRHLKTAAESLVAGINHLVKGEAEKELVIETCDWLQQTVEELSALKKLLVAVREANDAEVPLSTTSLQ